MAARNERGDLFAKTPPSAMPTPATVDDARRDEVVAPAADDDERQRSLDAAEPRNLLVLAAYEISFRIAWIFKTESVIVPAFLDELTGGAGAVRGWLPTLSRIGQSLPPLFLADRLRDAADKGGVLRRTTLAMVLPTAAIAGIAWGAADGIRGWMPPAFLGLYVLFFSLTGLNHVAQGTLHGKLIRADRRGRLMQSAGVLGPLLAIVAAWLLLGPWLDRPGVARFAPIFALTAAGFGLCGLATFALREPPDVEQRSAAVSPWDQLRAAWWVYRGDAEFRRAARVTMLLTCIVLIFPHFQWLARVRLGLSHRWLLEWVIAQNVGVACFNPLCGWLADRHGNRLALRLQCVVLCLAPLVALALAGEPGAEGLGARCYWIVFLLLGMSPVTMRTITNYTLELAAPELHPLYLSTMRVCFLAPFLFSPLAGAVLDLFADRPYAGAGWLFGTVSGLIGLAWALTFRMSEPRHRRPPE